MRRILIGILCAMMILQSGMLAEHPVVCAEENKTETEQKTEKQMEISAPSGILMEATSGKVIWEKDADTRRAPASVTKIMTLILIFDTLDAGKITLEEKVQTSEYAASMGGSQVFLEPGETQTVDTLIKCIAVASANDACVAMAEHIDGSEAAFVEHMNRRAKELKMENTTFVNCNGLDAEGHETTARDIALMSRELISKHPQVHDYSMIWMDTITHTTRKGSSEFGLTNTNKLVRQYTYATGLKTGSTGNAGFCVSATAKKDETELIAVVMGAENSKLRFQDAVKLLDVGFGKCSYYRDDDLDHVGWADVENGIQKQVELRMKEPFVYVDTEGADFDDISKKIEITRKIQAPVREGDTVGAQVYYLGEKEIGRQELEAAGEVPRLRYVDALEQAMERFFLTKSTQKKL